jgi:hypothetical protein
MLEAIIVGALFIGAFVVRIAAAAAFTRDPELSALYRKAGASYI